MALITPVLDTILPFPANLPYTFTFTVASGDQVVANEIEIYKNDDNTQITIEKISNFSFNHSITENFLVNGVEYKIHLRTYNSDNESSEWSDWVVFKCLATPLVTITNLNAGHINNQTYTFTGSYSQTEGEALQSYRFNLYDANGVLLKAYPEMFDGLLQQEVTGLDNNTLYKIELITITVSNLKTSTGLISFTTNYLEPKLGSLISLTNEKFKADILIQCKIIQIIGQSIGTIGYQDNDWVNTKDGTVYFQEGFTIKDNFTLQLWITDITQDVPFYTHYADSGTLKFMMYNNRIHVFKKYANNPISSHYASNQLNDRELVTFNYDSNHYYRPDGGTSEVYIDIEGDNVWQYHYDYSYNIHPIYIFCQQINDGINIEAQVIK